MIYRLLFLPFFIVPLIEVWIMVQVGRVIGAPPLIGLIILTAVIGVFFLRQQGLSTFLRAQRLLAEGQLPATELLEAGMLLVAGALLLTPGFATDAVGFTLLLPIARQWLAARLFVWLGKGMVTRGGEPVNNKDARQQRQDSRGQTTGSETIEGEFTREDGE